MNCRGILFDLDGVLVDSAECVERTWREWAAKHHLDAEEVISAAHGRRTIETLRLVAPELATEAEAYALESGVATISEGVREITGARELLESLAPDRWAVVTSGIRAVAEFRINLVGLPTPQVLVCADDISRGKPDPEGYLKAAAGLALACGECLVIEDAPAGIDAARAAGMRVVAIAATYPKAQLRHANAIVDRLTDVHVAFRGGAFTVRA